VLDPFQQHLAGLPASRGALRNRTETCSILPTAIAVRYVSQ